MDYITELIVWGVFISIATLIVWGALHLVGDVGRPVYQTDAQITEKEFTSARTTKSIVGGVPVRIHNRARWNVTVESAYGVGSIDVGTDFYNKVNVGDQVRIEFCKGRISGSFYIKKIL